jgi:hypothetical protein
MEYKISEIRPATIDIYFDIKDGKEEYPFYLTMSMYESDWYVESYGYDWNNLPQSIQDKAFEIADKYRKELRIKFKVLNPKEQILINS